MSKSIVITQESELVAQFQQLIAIEEDMNWNGESNHAAHEKFSRVQILLDGKSHCFEPVYVLKPSIPGLEELVSSERGVKQLLLVTPELSSRILDFCRKNGLNAIDLNGRTYLRAKGLLIDRQALPGRNYRFERAPRNVFAGKSARTVRTLLTNRDRTWVQSELVSRAKATSGLVSRIVRHLIHEGFLEKTGTRGFRVRDPFALLDGWAEADNFSRRVKATRYATFSDSPLDLAHRLRSLASEHSLKIAFTQWIAGWLRYPYTEPVVVSAYLSQIPSVSALESIGLRPVDEAGKVWLHVPADEGVFLETQPIQELPLASDAQIYLDLLKTGLRGPDQAAALRNWEGFCRP